MSPRHGSGRLQHGIHFTLHIQSANCIHRHRFVYITMVFGGLNLTVITLNARFDIMTVCQDADFLGTKVGFKLMQTNNYQENQITIISKALKDINKLLAFS